MDELDVKCVELAGLCHDLGENISIYRGWSFPKTTQIICKIIITIPFCNIGHGPFSHLWEGFVHEAEPDSDWHHEDNSIGNLV